MPNKSHFIIRNSKSISLGFKKNRNADHQEKIVKELLINYRTQQKHLLSSYRNMCLVLKKRSINQDPTLQVPHIQRIRIRFLTQAKKDIIENYQKFGLVPMTLSDMNQTVIFDIYDSVQFHQFKHLIDKFTNASPNDIPKDCHIITLIQDIEGYDNDQILDKTLISGDYDNVLMSLNGYFANSNQYGQIKFRLKQYVNENDLSAHWIGDTLLQFDSISKQQAVYIATNFDIINQIKVQDVRRFLAVKDEFGQEELQLGFNVHTAEDLPKIGVLDTGLIKDGQPWENISKGGKDISTTHNQPFKSHSDHGTTVSCLASFGLNYYQASRTERDIDADAFIYTIKVLDNETGSYNLAKIYDAIVEGYKQGIRIFNLSFCDEHTKAYNSDVSPFGYMLDQLAYDYDILCFISTGNLDPDMVKIYREDSAIPNGEEKWLNHPYHYFIPDSNGNVLSDISNLLSPADSLNNMTVGAIAENFDEHSKADLSQNKNYPAFYTLKNPFDYSRKINGGYLNHNQTNFQLIKPDIVMPGGDIEDKNSKMQVIGMFGGAFGFIKNSGTSYATPLAANLAAKIIRKYPDLKMQTVKALMINSAVKLHADYLSNVSEELKSMYRKDHDLNQDQLTNAKKSKITQLFKAERLNQRLVGHGRPDIDRCLSSDEDNVTLIVEDEIRNDSYKVIKLEIPNFLWSQKEKSRILIHTTLCYKFNPIPGNAIAYNPIHISFNIGNDINPENLEETARDYAVCIKKENEGKMSIKKHFSSWSEDFFPTSNKIFSNTQCKDFRFNSEELKNRNGHLVIIVRCTFKNDPSFEGKTSGSHPFSLVLRCSEEHKPKGQKVNLYDELQINNHLEAIAIAEGEAHIDVEA